MSTNRTQHNATDGRLTVRLDRDAVAALDAFLSSLGKLAPSRAAVVSEAVVRWVQSQRKRAA